VSVTHGAQHGSERGGGFAFAVSGIDEDEAARFVFFDLCHFQ
jgi:hypothetical protein